MLGKLTSPFKLRERGIMGMNQRNHGYIGKYNDRSKYPLVDDKLKTKIIAEKAGATTPALIASSVTRRKRNASTTWSKTGRGL
ncbi:alpha-L-glutamate ligase family protein [Vibrio maritimus]|uniref:Alpha-L-glutamate ligase family protein n=1 Tax=Vibrio maritimus TaxID=990268 RepID=A0A090SG51_9VIBR|nr:alpha-L-glutamate ligase family protein [Vibrio maritimus]